MASALSLLTQGLAWANVLDPKTLAPHYVHEVFSPKDGLPKAGMASLVGTPDGYLWIATFNGLVRFDGASFEIFDIESAPSLGSHRVGQVQTSEDGTLWIVSEFGHLARRRGGQFEGCDPPTHGSMGQCAPGHVGAPTFGPYFREIAGALWLLGTEGGMFRIEDGEVVTVPGPPDPSAVLWVFEESDGTLWVNTQENLWRRHQGRFESMGYTLAGGGSLLLGTSVAAAKDSSLWMRSTETIGRVRVSPAGEMSLEPLSSLIPLAARAWSSAALAGPLGHLWINVDEALLRYRDGVLTKIIERPGANSSPVLEQRAAVDPEGHSWALWDQFAVREEGPLVLRLTDGDDVPSALWIDPTGILWVTSSRGNLHALYPSQLEAISGGLENPSLVALTEDLEGGYWVSGASLGHLPSVRPTDSPTDDPQEFVDYAYPGEWSRPVNVVAQDLSGTVWVGTQRGVFTLEHGDYRGPFGPETLSMAIISALTLKGQHLWVGSNAGLFEHTLGDPEKGWRQISLEGVGNPSIRGVHVVDRGDLWLSTSTHGLIHWTEDRVRLFDREAGFPSQNIRSLWSDTDGHLWVSTNTAGLVRLDPSSEPGNPIFSTIGPEQGLSSRAIHQVVDDGVDDLWISSNDGIFRGRLEDFRAVADGRLSRIPLTHYTEQDGMFDREANGGTLQSGILDSSGRVVFPTQAGLVRFDPQRPAPAEPLPTAFIDRLVVGQTPRPIVDGSLRLGAEERSFSVEYSAPHLRAAEALRFKIRLVPYDSEWVEVGPRRSAFYTRVPAGHYRFEVTVAHDEIPHRGRWNPEPATLELQIAPYYYETTAFRMACVILGVGLILGLVRWRFQHLRTRAAALEVTVAERTATIAEQAEKLRELDRVKSEFFANVSHEFRTPLTLIIGSLRDFLDSPGGGFPKGLQAYPSLALENAQRLLHLVDQLLDVAKLDAGGLRLRPSHGDLDALLRLAVERATPFAERQGVELTAEIPPTPIHAHFDPTQLEKVFDNLLGNALKFTPAGRSVHLHAKPPTAEAWMVTVEDEGPGIPTEDLERIFDRFHQANHETLAQGAGTGLGLTLARQILELHEGTLTADNRSSGGAIFTASAPLEPSFEGLVFEGTPELPPAPEVSRPSNELLGQARGDVTTPVRLAEPIDGEDRATILVADDHPDLRAYLRRHLEAEYRVVEAADGQEALALARQGPPDVVVSDIMMPGLDGRQLFRTLRQDPELELVPVILVTAIASADRRLEGLREGVDDYLVKPFDPRELRARIQNILASRRRLLDRLAPPAPQSTPVTDGLSVEDREFLERVHRTIEVRIDDTDLTVELLARELHCDRSHLLRRLRALTDQTPSSLIRTLRLRRAEELLRAQAGRVNEIAYSVGFKSLAHFSNAFNQEYGERPSAYAARHRTIVH